MKKNMFYRRTAKGELLYAELVEIHDENKLVIDYKDILRDDEKLKNAKRVFNPTFERKVKKLSRQGYTFSYPSPSLDASTYEEVMNALNLHDSLEKLVPLSLHRPRPGEYFDILLIKKAFDSYRRDMISLVYLSHWIHLFTYAVEESFSFPMTKEDIYRYSVLSVLAQFDMLMDKGLETEDLKKKALETREKIYVMDKYYQKDKGEEK